MENLWGKYSNKIPSFISWIINIASLIVGVYGVATGSKFATNIIYLMIIINSLILISLGFYMANIHFQKLNLIKENERNQLQYEAMNNELRMKIENQENAFFTLEANDNYMIATLNKFLNDLFNLTEVSSESIDSIQNEEIDMRAHGYNDDEIERKIVLLAKQKNDRISEKIYDDYKRFLRNILDKVQENIESYLRAKGYCFKVSVTIKLLVEPKGQDEKGYIDEKNVYTAFRDNRTWSQKERNEVEHKLYVIRANSDFVQCLSRGHYIFNNKSRDSHDYDNENKDFDKHYNSGVTTLLYSKKQHEDKKIYGFLACDILNTIYKNDEIMDVRVAQMLDTAAYTIAVYFDNAEYNWYLCQGSTEYSTFWQMVYNRHLLEK